MLQMYQAADRKAKMTLIGVCLMKFAGGLSLIWGSCNVYFFSYLKHHGEYIGHHQLKTSLVGFSSIIDHSSHREPFFKVDRLSKRHQNMRPIILSFANGNQPSV